MSSDAIRSHLKSAPILIFRRQVSFTSPFTIEECLNHLETSPIHDDLNFQTVSIGEVVKEGEGSQIYFAATLSSRFSVDFLGKVEANNEGEGCRISGYIGCSLLWPVGLISIATLVAGFLGLQYSPISQDILAIYILFDLVAVIVCYGNTRYLAPSLESIIRGILTE